MSAARLPEFLRPYFWDTDFDRWDSVEHKRFIAERLMEKTTRETFRWLLTHVRVEVLRDLAHASSAAPCPRPELLEVLSCSGGMA
jgi:hypothetical protein